MSRFEDYREKYQTINMERDRGVLTIRFHTDGGPLRWGGKPYREFPQAFRDIAEDNRNLVVIMTGTGAEFSGTRGFEIGSPDQLGYRNVDRGRYHPRNHLCDNLLYIEVPIIAAVNGPAWRHAELALLSDIVLASEDAAFQDSSHFINGLPPGDGQHVILPMAIGINRARYYLLTGQVLSAQDAERYGLVNEVLPREKLMDRAHELANMLLKQPAAVLRNTRLILVEQIKRNMAQYYDHGNGLEALGMPVAGEAGGERAGS
jgi:enoyl-CoA hydratase/carnithine racemase